MSSSLAINSTKETQGLLTKVIDSDDYVKFSLQNRINLHSNTILFRLSLLNLFTNELPSSEQIQPYKSALFRPPTFDDFLKDFTLKIQESEPKSSSS